MKKLYSFLLFSVVSFSFGQTFYSENMGTTASGNPLITAYTGFQNPAPIVYSGTGDMRTTTVSTGYAGASGSVNVFLSNTTTAEFFQIDGLNTSAYTSANIQLKFGYLANGAANAGLIVEFSTDATNWTPITYTTNTNSSWNLVTVPGGTIPSSATLSLRFTQPNLAAQIRIDDVSLTNFNASCVLSLGTPTTLCTASTIDLDTYTVTIPYTNGGTASYVITPNSGTVGGDNPSTVAAGNIVISGVNEGTAFSATIVGGTCNFTSTANSPECKPVNTLPYSESFPYIVGNPLNAEQKWTIVNTGDNILVTTGNLNYAGVTSTGNSVSWAGAGAESRTPFTNTTAGTLYASFLTSITDITNVTTDLASTYFAVFTDATGATTNARVWIRKNGTQYQYGLGTGAAATNWDTTLYNVGETQFVVLGYDFANNSLTLTINGTVGGSATPTIAVTPTTAFTALGGFILRQDGAATTPTIVFDELRISEIPPFTLGVAQNSIAGLSITPNPVNNGVFYINTDANAERTVTIFDIVGKQVVNKTTSNSEINVSELNSGIYFVQIIEEGKTATKKLIIK